MASLPVSLCGLQDRTASLAMAHLQLTGALGDSLDKATAGDSLPRPPILMD